MSSAALSDFGQRAVDERQRLLGDLVYRLTGSQPSSQQHQTLLEAALAGTQHHQFADPVPRIIDELLDRLGERLGENAQFGKQRALQLLRQHLLATPIDSSQYEFPHRLLAFLYAASRAPLSTHYPGSALVAALEAQARTAVVGEPTYLTDASSEGSWVEDSGLYSPGSVLSDWSDAGEAADHAEAVEAELMSEGEDGGEGAAGSALPAAAGAQGGLRGVGAEPGRALAHSPLRTAAGGPARPFLPPSQQAPPRETPYTRTSLSVWLASRRSGGQPARVLHPAMCFHERELVQQVLHMLKGVCHPGPAFMLDPVRDAYQPRPGVHLHSSSLGSARSLLARFARAASAVRRVQAFCAAVGAHRGGAAAGGAGWEGSEAAADELGQVPEQVHSEGGAGVDQEMEDASEQRLLGLPTVAAFASAVAEQEQGLQQQVLVLEAAAASGALCTLQQLQQRTVCLAGQAALLAALVRRCCVWRGTPADTSAGLLSALHEALQQQMLLARSQGGVLAATALRLFAASCRPLLGMLHKWLYRGVLDDPFEEFFVRQAPGADIPTDSPRFWSDAFVLRYASPGSLAAAAAAAAAGPGSAAPPAAPSFLAPLADSILAAGKSVLLLQAYSSWRIAAAAASANSAAAAGGGRLLASNGAVHDGGPPSPAKRRLSEMGALGFAMTADPQRQRHDHREGPFSAPPPPTAEENAAAVAGVAVPWAAGGGAPDGLGPEPLPLHQQLLRGLEAQLQEQLAQTTQQQREEQQQQDQFARKLRQKQQQQAGEQPDLSELPCRGSKNTSNSMSTNGRLFSEDWQQADAACGGHTLQLPVQDTLPPLPELPASADGLPVAGMAAISPAAVSDASKGTDVVWCSSSGSKPSSDASQPTVADRMRRAGAARTAQATGEAAAQLPLLIIPPAPLEACVAAGHGERAEPVASGASCAQGAAATGQQSGSAAAEPTATSAQQFESRTWQEWYQHTAAALSQQLHVLDCLGPGTGAGAAGAGAAGSRTGRSRQQLASSFGVPLGLSTDWSGSACDQLWGRGRKARDDTIGDAAGGNACSSLQLQEGRRQQRMLPALAAAAPPLDVLLSRSLVQPVQAQVDAAGAALCAVLLRRGLLRQLSTMREVYLLGSPLLEPFVSFLLRRISTPSGLDRVSEFELNAALQDALAAGGSGGTGTISSKGAGRLLRATAHIVPPSAEQLAQQAQQARQAAHIPQRVHALAQLRLRVEPGWPLCLLVGEEMLGQYNAVLVLLLQLRWVKQSLQSVRYQGWKAGRRASQSSAARDGLQHQMVHFVDSVLQYMTDRVIAAGSWLEQAVEACGSLDAMHRCRAKYLRAVTRYCLLSPDGVARLVHEALLHLLNACLHYCALRKQHEMAAAALAALAAQQAAGAGGSSVAAAGAGGAVDEDVGGVSAEGLSAGQPSAPVGLRWAGRRAELQRRAAEAQAGLAALRRDWGNRQRLLLRVLATKAAEAGSHADELRQLLGALDFSRFYEHSMA